MKFKLYFFVLALLPLAFFLRYPDAAHHTQMASQAVLKPLITAGDSVSRAFSDVVDSFFIFWQTFERQKENQQVIAALEARLEDYDEMRRENQRLLKLLDLRESLEMKTIPARVIGWDLSPWRQSLILDKGAQHGIQKDMALVVNEGLCARIVEVGPATSRAVLLIDSESSISAVASESRAQGVVSGDGSRNLRLRYLELDSGAKVGETVLSSGITGVFPAGLRIGKIESIEKDKDGLHLAALVKPFADMKKAEEVLCIASTATK